MTIKFRKIFCSALLLLTTINSFCQSYEGKISTLRFGVKIEKSPTKIRFFVPDQMTYDMPMSQTRWEKDTIFSEFTLNNVKLKGHIVGDSVFVGEWLQNGRKTPLSLKKVPKFSFSHNRPQTPQAPFPYQIEDVTFYNTDKSIKFGGTLTFPKITGKKFTTVVLISGSGQQDRDESLADHKPFWVIADYLSRNGFAVLRIDDRQIGETTGTVGTSADCANDVLSAIDFLKKRKEINPKKIGLIGHSEGGLIAPLAAMTSKDVAFIVSLAGLGVKGKELLLRQNEDILLLSGVNAIGRQGYKELNEKIFTIIENVPIKGDCIDTLTKTFEAWVKLQPKERLNAMGLETFMMQKNYTRQLQSMNNEWYKFFMRYDPYPTLSKLTIPILALNGEKDIQVAFKENLSVFENAAQKANNINVKTQSFADLNHLFQHCTTGSTLEYVLIEETIAPEILKIMGDWLLKI